MHSLLIVSLEEFICFLPFVFPFFSLQLSVIFIMWIVFHHHMRLWEQKRRKFNFFAKTIQKKNQRKNDIQIFFRVKAKKLVNRLVFQKETQWWYFRLVFSLVSFLLSQIFMTFFTQKYFNFTKKEIILALRVSHTKCFIGCEKSPTDPFHNMAISMFGSSYWIIMCRNYDIFWLP